MFVTSLPVDPEVECWHFCLASAEFISPLFPDRSQFLWCRPLVFSQGGNNFFFLSSSSSPVMISLFCCYCFSSFFCFIWSFLICCAWHFSCSCLLATPRILTMSTSWYCIVPFIEFITVTVLSRTGFTAPMTCPANASMPKQSSRSCFVRRGVAFSVREHLSRLFPVNNSTLQLSLVEIVALCSSDKFCGLHQCDLGALSVLLSHNDDGELSPFVLF